MPLIRKESRKQNKSSVHFKKEKKDTAKLVKTPSRRLDWDYTVNDLTQYKATPEEVERRRSVYESKNREIAKQELKDKKVISAIRKKNQIASSLVNNSSFFCQTVLNCSENLQSVLDESDRTLAAVEDLFGDYRGKYRGNFAYTTAPSSSDPQTDVVTSTKPGRPLGSSTAHSGSRTVIVCKSALNSFSDSSPEKDPTEDSPVKDTPSRSLSYSKENAACLKSNHVDEDSFTVADTSRGVKEPTKQSQDAQQDADKSGSKSNLKGGLEDSQMKSVDEFKQVMGHLAQDIEEYERMLGTSSSTQQPFRTESLSGYTAMIVGAISRILQFSKQSHLQLQQEMLTQEQLKQEVREFKTILDVLTTDLLAVQEENIALRKLLDEKLSLVDQQVVGFKKLVQPEVNPLPIKLNGGFPLAPAENGISNKPPTQAASSAAGQQRLQPAECAKRSSDQQDKHVALAAIQKEQELLRQEIAELNRQREEAQKTIDQICRNPTPSTDIYGCERPASQTELSSYPVSPSISPIPRDAS